MKRNDNMPETADAYDDEIEALAQHFIVNMEALDINDPTAVAHWRQGAFLRRESLKRMRKHDDPAHPAIPAAVAAYAQKGLHSWSRASATCPTMQDRSCYARVFFQPDYNRVVTAVWLDGDGGEGDAHTCDVISANNYKPAATPMGAVDVMVAGYGDTAFHLTPGRPLIINAMVNDEITDHWDRRVVRTQALEAAVAMDEALERKLARKELQ